MNFKELNFSNLGSRPEISVKAMATIPLFRELLNKKSGHLSEMDEEGPIKFDDADADEAGHQFLDLIKAKGGRLVHKFISSVGVDYFFLWKDSALEASISGKYIAVKAISHREEFIREIKTWLDERWSHEKPKGHIYAIMKQGNHLALSSIGNAGIPLVDSNYTKKVMEDYKYIINDLKSSTPSGRIIIMEGKPGTGKTHLVRAMLMEVPDAMFVLVSPEMVTTLAGPELLPLLINHRGATLGPIVLVLEDADRCLVTRGAENMSSIQSLLNLGDGILGSLLDLRIVATTNAKKLDMEEAILRPGRLSKRLEVGPVDIDTAQNIFRRLLPNANMSEKLSVSEGNGVPFAMTLAEVYFLARENGWSPELRKQEDDEEDDDINLVDFDL